MKRAGVCISQTGSGIWGGSTKVVNGEGRVSSTCSMMRSYDVGSTFGGTGEPPPLELRLSCGVAETNLVSNTTTRKIQDEILREFMVIKPILIKLFRY